MATRKRRDESGQNPNDPDVWQQIAQHFYGKVFHWGGEISTQAKPAMLVMKNGEAFGVITPTSNDDTYTASLVIGHSVPTIEDAMILMQEMSRQYGLLVSVPACMLSQGEDITQN